MPPSVGFIHGVKLRGIRLAPSVKRRIHPLLDDSAQDLYPKEGFGDSEERSTDATDDDHHFETTSNPTVFLPRDGDSDPEQKRCNEDAAAPGKHFHNGMDTVSVGVHACQSVGGRWTYRAGSHVAIAGTGATNPCTGRTDRHLPSLGVISPETNTQLPTTYSHWTIRSMRVYSGKNWAVALPSVRARNIPRPTRTPTSPVIRILPGRTRRTSIVPYAESRRKYVGVARRIGA